MYLYSSVVTCRHIAINTSVGTSRNAKKIAEKKGSYVEVSMFGPEL